MVVSSIGFLPHHVQTLPEVKESERKMGPPRVRHCFLVLGINMILNLSFCHTQEAR